MFVVCGYGFLCVCVSLLYSVYGYIIKQLSLFLSSPPLHTDMPYHTNNIPITCQSYPFKTPFSHHTGRTELYVWLAAAG